MPVNLEIFASIFIRKYKTMAKLLCRLLIIFQYVTVISPHDTDLPDLSIVGISDIVVYKMRHEVM